MFIPISSRDCSTAIGKAIEANKARVATDIDRLKEEAYTALRTGAEHNGMKVDDARDKEMREMIDRVMLWTFWGGIALYTLVLHPLFARLYARLMALPERS